MSDEKTDESMGLENLPQSELEASPGNGEQSSPATDDTNVDKVQEKNQFITQDNKDEISL